MKDNRDGIQCRVVVAVVVAPLAAYSCGALASLPARPCGISRLVIPSPGAISASRSSTGANILGCFCTSGRNSSIEAQPAIRAGLFGSPASFTAPTRRAGLQIRL